jgi:enterochelin esterase-like enzyme
LGAQALQSAQSSGKLVGVAGPTIDDILTQIDSSDAAEAPTWVQHLLQHPELPAAQDNTALRAARAIAVHSDYQQMPIAHELSKRAFTANVPGAGSLYAECTDKLSLMQGKAQPFGTATIEHQGEVVMLPVDPTVGDDERAAVGLPPLAQLQANVIRQNRAAAEVRLEGELPRGVAFARVWTNPTADEVRTKLAEHPEGSWENGDIVTFATNEPGAGMMAGPVFELPMWKVPEQDGTNSDLFILEMRMNNATSAVIGYGFWPLDQSGMPVSGGRGPVPFRFRGSTAPAQLPSNEDDALVGSFATHQVDSLSLGPRQVSVYLPPGHSPDESLPVVYATDGNMFGPFARRLDAGMDSGDIPRAVVVAAHSARMDAIANERADEYLPGFNEDRFTRHQRFFVDELSTWAEGRFGVSAEREQRAIFGTSDGGGHSIATGWLHRHRYAHCIAYSTGMPPNPEQAWAAEEAPFIHLCAGTLEGPFFQATEAWAAWLHFQKSPHHFTERVCGHDLIQWIEELPRAISRAWG